jgi:hypothetical protein
MLEPSIPVFAQLYQDYGCTASLMITFPCFDKEFQVDGIPVYAAYYRCNKHGIAVYDENFKIMKVAPMQHYYIAKQTEPRYFLMHVYDSNLLHMIEGAKMTPIEIANSCALRR